ncbi:MAG: argininosuccinate lyase, partial [Methanothrix sp.]|nr:argininosuccinate lyase [Methanothrix sp.]
RTAHSIVGRIAAFGQRPSLAQLDAVALEVAGFRPSECGFSSSDLDRALDPKSNVALRENIGGPGPFEVNRMVKERFCLIAEHATKLSKRRDKVGRALSKLRMTK